MVGLAVGLASAASTAYSAYEGSKNKGASGTGGGVSGAIQGAFGSPAQIYSKNPAWLDDASQDVYNKANAASSVPYQAYGGEQVAGLSPNQTYAIQSAAQNLNRYDPVTNQINSYLSQSSKPITTTFTPTVTNYNNVSTSANPQAITTKDFTQADINGYMNPYLQASLAPQLQQLNQNYADQQTIANSKAAGSGNFGGSRQGIMNALINKQQNTDLQNVTAQGYNTAFNNAQNAFETDQGRNLQGQQAQAGIYGQDTANKLQADLANQGADINTQQFNENQNANAYKTNYQTALDNRTALQTAASGLNSALGTQVNLNNSNIANLLSTGGAQQSVQQSQDTVNYQNFLQQQGYPAQQAAYLASILAASPDKSSLSNGTDVTGDNGVSNLIGQLGSLLGGSSSSSGSSGLLGGLGGLLGGGSSGGSSGGGILSSLGGLMGGGAESGGAGGGILSSIGGLFG